MDNRYFGASGKIFPVNGGDGRMRALPGAAAGQGEMYEGIRPVVFAVEFSWRDGYNSYVNNGCLVLF
jgi:hypothetical protein